MAEMKPREAREELVVGVCDGDVEPEGVVLPDGDAEAEADSSAHADSSGSLESIADGDAEPPG